MQFIDKLKKIITWRLILGLFSGAILGFAYYYFIGCNAGSCSITSSPVNSTIFGAIFGALILMK
jgi:Na+-transporting NADH:ubiquinone oxidoreductase subunit NqrB